MTVRSLVPGSGMACARVVAAESVSGYNLVAVDIGERQDRQSHNRAARGVPFGTLQLIFNLAV